MTLSLQQNCQFQNCFFSSLYPLQAFFTQPNSQLNCLLKKVSHNEFTYLTLKVSLYIYCNKVNVILFSINFITCYFENLLGVCMQNVVVNRIGFGISAPYLFSCVNLGKLLHHSVSQFPNLQTRDNNINSFKGLLEG